MAQSVIRRKRCETANRPALETVSLAAHADAADTVKSWVDWLPYIDDYLGTIKGPNVKVRNQRAQAEMKHADAALDFLGLSKHAEKGQWEPKPAIDHLGLLIDSEPKRHQFKTTAKFLAKIKRAAADLIGAAMRNRRLVNDRKLRSFCGLVQSKYLAIAPAQLFLRSCHDDLNKCHEHVGLDGVALGKDIVATRKAIAHQQAAVMEETTRVRLPAEHAQKVLLAAF